MKKRNLVILLALLSASLSGCFNDNTDATSKAIDLVNLSSDYNIANHPVNVYFINNDESTPYVNVKEFLEDLNGYFNKKSYLYIKDLLSNSYSILNSYGNVTFDWEKDTISVSNMDVFFGIVNNSSTTNYSSYIGCFDSSSEGKEEVVFNLPEYGYKVEKIKDGVLIPLVIANTLFCSPNYLNLYYRGDKLFSFVGEIDTSDPEYATIYGGNATAQNNEVMRESTINSLCFVMDYFYGLKEDKNITKFKDYIPNEIMTGLKSSSGVDNRNAIKSLLVTSLDDLHTRVDSVNFYYPKNQQDEPYYLEDLGTFGQSYYGTKKTQNNLRNTTFSNDVPNVRYQGDTAIIVLDSFKTGSNEQIFNGGEIKQDAWKYDSYWFMQKCMDDIATHPEVNDILLDISLNGGGNIGALIRVFGFLTDEYYLDYELDTLTHEKTVYKYLVDTDRDGKYNDNDSYSNYRWTLLSGINTFSAANALITKVKQAGIAKVIGQKSGGGMCSVLPVVLQDGTAVALSSQNTIRLYKNGEYLSTEYGHEPDLEVPYEEFYSDSLLETYVDQVNEN